MKLKVLANEDTLLRTHCCRHKCFPVCPRAQHLLRKQILCPGHKNVSDFVQKHVVSATNVSQFARARKRHEQQCFRNNVSSFATALTQQLICINPDRFAHHIFFSELVGSLFPTEPPTRKPILINFITHVTFSFTWTLEVANEASKTAGLEKFSPNFCLFFASIFFEG